MLWKSGGGWKHALAAILLAWVPATVSLAKGPNSAEKPAETTIAVAQLPAQGQRVLTLIYQGGPFKHDKDGTVFGNRERLLPLHPRGYYREYTVRTPGVSHRGARRIVCGGKQVTAPDACYYTEDHYASFRRIVQ
jgi:ribonuclease T1